MVYINTKCINKPAGPGEFGGSKCVCTKCIDYRAQRDEAIRQAKNPYRCNCCNQVRVLK